MVNKVRETENNDGKGLNCDVLRVIKIKKQEFTNTRYTLAFII